jgi:alkylation response protein AidB-like acyl-CoA dehydrogenase
MMRPAGKAFPEDPPLLHAAIEFGPKIRAAGDEMERMRRIPPHLAQAMRDTGVFGMVLPRSWGAPELDPLTQIRVIEAMAMAEGSAGWCAMIGCDSGYITAFLDEHVAREMYPDIGFATAATATATARQHRCAAATG